MNDHPDLYIDGAWVAPIDPREPIEVVNPTNEEVVAAVAAAGPADVDRAVTAAARAFKRWSTTSADQRAAYLRSIADGLEARSDECADLIATEVGTPRKLAVRVQTGLPIRSFRAAADLAVMADATEERNGSMVVREAAGVVGAITPWNYPLHQIAAKVAYALAAGCTVVLKPSEVAPLNAILLAEVMDEVGLPPGVFNLLMGTGPVVGESIATHGLVEVVSFTGSTRAGTRVAALAAGSVKRVSLELGGKSANVILDDLDDDTFTRAVSSGVAGAFFNSGQTCSALTRMVVPRHLMTAAEEIAIQAAEGMVVGDPFEPATRIGPVVSSTQRDRVRSYIERGVEEGATLLTGGPTAPDGLATGYFVRPTVFSSVEPYMTIAREEIFGPVLCLFPHTGDDDAVSIANDSEYGLGGSVWSADAERGLRVARRIRTGQVQINGAPFDPTSPFGGFKRSGVGRELGSHGLDEFLEIKAINR